VLSPKAAVGLAAVFNLLGVLLMALAIALRPALGLPAWGLFLFAVAVAVADEGLQFLSDRAPRLADVLLDSVGAGCGLVVAWLFGRLWRSRLRAAMGRNGHV
jgi:VanZ family protein